MPVKKKYGMPVTTHDRFVAAQELRRNLNILRSMSLLGPGITLGQRGQMEKYTGAAGNHLDRAKMLLPKLREAAKERKAAQMRLLLDKLDAELHFAASYHQHTVNYLQGNIANSAPVHHGIDLELLYQYAQSIPTVDDLPRTPAENTLRAIGALLRHHHWEEKGVTENGKKLDETAKALAAELGKPQPVGASPIAGYDEEEPPDDDDPDA